MQLSPVSPTAKAPAQAFTGDVYVTPIYTGQEPSRMTVALVRSPRRLASNRWPARFADGERMSGAAVAHRARGLPTGLSHGEPLTCALVRLVSPSQ